MCAVERCGRKASRRGWCHKHYLRWHRYGQVEKPDPPIPRDLIPGVTPQRVAQVKRVAGDGDLDERCRRLLSHFGPGWFGQADDRAA